MEYCERGGREGGCDAGEEGEEGESGQENGTGCRGALEGMASWYVGFGWSMGVGVDGGECEWWGVLNCSDMIDLVEIVCVCV